MFLFIILNVMDAFAWFVLINKEAIVSTPQTTRTLLWCQASAKRICLASTMDSTIWRVALQRFTDEVEVLLNVAINKKVTIIVRRMINASLVQYLCTKIRVEYITSFVGSVPFIVLQLFLCLL